MLKTHITSFYKCILCICNICDYEKIKYVYNLSHENLILYKGGKKDCTECFEQFKEHFRLIKDQDRFIKDDLEEEKDLCHVPLVDDD